MAHYSCGLPENRKPILSVSGISSIIHDQGYIEGGKIYPKKSLNKEEQDFLVDNRKDIFSCLCVSKVFDALFIYEGLK